jgi:hypothetical protein
MGHLCYHSSALKTLPPFLIKKKVLMLTYSPQVKCFCRLMSVDIVLYSNVNMVNKGNNKITELRTILQRESQNS